MTGSQHIANDNEKATTFGRVATSRLPRSYPSPRPSPIKAREIHPQTFAQPAQTPAIKPTADAPMPWKLNLLALLTWLGALAALFFIHRDLGIPLYKIGASVVFGWASLFLLSVSKRQNRTFFKSLGMFGMLASFAVMGYSLYRDFNIHITPELSLIVGMAISLALGVLLREKHPLYVSGVLLAAWVGMTQFGGMASELMWLIPSIAIAQYLAGSKLNSRLSTILLSVSCLVWLGSSVMAMVDSSYLSTQQALGMLILGGIGYNRFGKHLQDKAKPTGLVHTNIAWALAAISGLCLQYIWGAGAAVSGEVNVDKKAFYSMIAATIFVSLTAAIFLINLYRSKSGHQSRAETLSVTGLALLLALSVANPTLLVGTVAYISKAPTQFVSLMTGGILTAAALGIMVNGARRGILIMMFLGLGVLVAELYLIIPQLVVQPEHLYAFGYSCLFSLLFLAMFAQYKQTHASPRYRSYVPGS